MTEGWTEYSSGDFSRTLLMIYFPRTLRVLRASLRNSTNFGMNSQLSAPSGCSKPWPGSTIHSMTTFYSGCHIHNNHHAKWFFHRGHVKRICQMAWSLVHWFMKAWVALRGLNVIREKSSEEKRQLVLESSKQASTVWDCRFSSAKGDILRKGYTVMKSFATDISSFVPIPCLTAIDWNDTVTHFALTDASRFVLISIDGW